MISEQRRVIGIDNTAAMVDGHVVGMNARDLEHGDEQSGFVFTVSVTIAEYVRGMIGLKAADAALDDEVANVFLDGFGDAREPGVEVRSAGDEGLNLSGDFRRGCGAIGLKLGDPCADGAPLVVFSIDGCVAPLHGHAGGGRDGLRARRYIAKDEGGCVFEFPTPMIR